MKFIKDVSLEKNPQWKRIVFTLSYALTYLQYETNRNLVQDIF